MPKPWDSEAGGLDLDWAGVVPSELEFWVQSGPLLREGVSTHIEVYFRPRAWPSWGGGIPESWVSRHLPLWLHNQIRPAVFLTARGPVVDILEELGFRFASELSGVEDGPPMALPLVSLEEHIETVFLRALHNGTLGLDRICHYIRSLGFLYSTEDVARVVDHMVEFGQLMVVEGGYRLAQPADATLEDRIAMLFGNVPSGGTMTEAQIRDGLSQLGWVHPQSALAAGLILTLDGMLANGRLVEVPGVGYRLPNPEDTRTYIGIRDGAYPGVTPEEVARGLRPTAMPADYSQQELRVLAAVDADRELEGHIERVLSLSAVSRPTSSILRLLRADPAVTPQRGLSRHLPEVLDRMLQSGRMVRTFAINGSMLFRLRRDEPDVADPTQLAASILAVFEDDLGRVYTAGVVHGRLPPPFRYVGTSTLGKALDALIRDGHLWFLHDQTSSGYRLTRRVGADPPSVWERLVREDE